MREIEKGVPLKEFNDSMQARELDAEFRLIRKLTETKEHLSNCETFDKKTNAFLNRYAELKPCKLMEYRITRSLNLNIIYSQAQPRETPSAEWR